MPATDPRDRKILHRRTAVRTVAFYAVFTGLWICFSDSLLAWFISDPSLITSAQTIKEWLYLVVMATLLYFYLSHCPRALWNREKTPDDEQDKRQQDVLDRCKQLDTLFDSLNAVVYVADLETNELLYVNRFAAELFGQDWRGRRCYHYLQKGLDKPCDFCTNPQLINNGDAGDPILWEFFNPGNKRWYQCFDKTIRWTGGRLVRLEVALDVTERKVLEKMKEDLLSSVCHEMRTPLTAISGFAELLVNAPGVPEQHGRHIDIIFREAEKLAELINHFLGVSRLKTDGSRINYEYSPVLELLQKAKKGCRDSEEHHDIQIGCQTDLQIYGNRRELTQVVTQLLEHACRYSPKGGKISLTAQGLPQKISILITNQGIDLPQHEQDEIFKPFHGLDTGDERNTGVVGLGLSVAKNIVSLHGGQILVKSVPGQGSTVRIVLPIPVDKGPLANDKPPGAAQS